MFGKIIHFIKYNNAMVLILALVFVAGSGVFAQTEAGQEFIGTETTRIEGRDNTLLIEADLENFNPDYKIEKIEADDKYYYVTYTCLELRENEKAWEYQLNEKVRKVSKKLKSDLGEYLAKEFGEERAAQIKALKIEQAKAESEGPAVRTETTEYSGLIGRTLALAERVFPGYDAVKVRQLPAPDIALSLPRRADEAGAQEDDLAKVYEDFVARHDPDQDNLFSSNDNCPEISNPDQADRDGDGLGDACDRPDELIPAPENEEAEAIGEEENIPAENLAEEDAADGAAAEESQAIDGAEIKESTPLPTDNEETFESVEIVEIGN